MLYPNRYMQNTLMKNVITICKPYIISFLCGIVFAWAMIFLSKLYS